MATKKTRALRNNKRLPRCVCCGKLCSCEFIHKNCIFEYLEKHDYFVLDINLRRVFGFGGVK